LDIKNLFGESFQRFMIASATMANHIQDKPEKERTALENDFVESFEEVADILISPEFQQLIIKWRAGKPEIQT
jgi:hypothetical protein